MSKPLFSFGTSRGGTTFFARILSVNRAIKIASDPFLPIFRSLRTTIIRQKIDPEFNGDLPLDDYYFSKRKIEMMKAIQGSDLSLPLPAKESDILCSQLLARMDLAAKELVPLFSGFRGNTYFDLFQNGLKLLEKAYNSSDGAWTGFNDNWVIEFLPLLMRSFPMAKFIIIIRDPRAAMASSMNLRKKDPSLVPLMYSFAHHWRKHVAFAIMLMNNSLLKERLFVFRYEDLVREPEKKIRELCEFLEVEYDEAMLDTDKFRPLSGDQWKVYSNFKVPETGIYTDRIEGWREFLAKGTLEFIEFICDPEMSYFGYQPEEYRGEFPSTEILNFLIKDDKIAQGWRGEHESWDIEYAYELFRKQVLKNDKESLATAVIEKDFLFEAVYKALVSGGRFAENYFKDHSICYTQE